jgi:hypothetical protein
MIDTRSTFEEKAATLISCAIQDLRKIMDEIEANDIVDGQDFESRFRGVAIKISLLKRMFQEAPNR